MRKRECKVCGKKFTARYAHEIVCCDECRKERIRIKQREYLQRKKKENEQSTTN